MNVEQIGIVKIKQILKEVANKYQIKKESIDVYDSHHKQDVQFKFEIIEDNKYNIKKIITLDLNDIIDIVKDILKKDNINTKDIKPYFEHISGDSFEPLDYGSYEFKGFDFTIVK